jgi:hypothetical protein
VSISRLIDTWWRRRDDGWIAGVENTESHPRPGKPRLELARLTYVPVTGPVESTVTTEEALRRDYEQVREVTCRRCKTREVWRFVGKGERYVRHGCAEKRRQRIIDQIRSEEIRASAASMYFLLERIVGEDADPIGEIRRSARSILDSIDDLVRVRATEIRRS